jgi:long-chain fatty acid transport protein
MSLIDKCILAVVAVACGALSAGEAAAAGFAVSEQGAGAAGVGGAATARSDLLEAAFYNPSAFALEGERGWAGWAGATLLAPTLTHTSPGGVETSTLPSLAPVPALRLGGAVGDFGVSATWGVPYGSGLRWPEDWAGRTASIASSVQVFEGGVDVSWRPLDWLAVGMGARLQRGILGLEQGIDVIDPDADARVRIAGDAWAPAWGAHVLARPIAPLRVGLTYRSGSVLEMQGQADFTGVPRELEPSAHDSTFTAAFPTPWRAALGVAWTFEGVGVVSADLESFGWGVFDELVIDFDDPDLDDAGQPRRWSTTLAARLGYEHLLADGLRLRAGATWDPSPSTPETLSPSSPDTDRLGGALGVGWRSGWGLSLDASASFTALLGAEGVGEDAYPGRYGGSILGVGLGVGFVL